MKRIAVVGAGLSGLATAHRLSELSRERGVPLEITVLETSDRVGGSLETVRENGWLFERGPDSFLSEKPAGVALCKRLGLESELVPTRTEFRRSFVARGHALLPVPAGFYLVAPSRVGPFLKSPLFSPFGKLRALAEPFVPARRGGEEETVASFVRRRFGNEILERAGQAMVGGIYGGDPDALSIEATLPRFREWESSFGSVTRGLRAERSSEGASGPRYGLFTALKNGMGELALALAKRSGAAIRLGTAIRSIERLPAGWELADSNGIRHAADAVCVALPAPLAARLVRPHAPAAADGLEGIRLESMAVLHFGFPSSRVRHSLEGFGFVVPRREKRTLVACSFSHRKFEGRAPESRVLLRAFAGGAFGREASEMTDSLLEVKVLEELKAILGLEGEPEVRRVFRHPAAMVQYGVGHRERAARIRSALGQVPGLWVSGAAFGGVGIPDVIADAESQAERAFASLQGR